MRSIINRKIYDTKNADEVARNHRHNRNNISWFNEVLYLTKNGAWFLAGEGGPLSKYSVDLGRGERDGGSALTPLTPEGAIAWLEEHGEYALLEAYFSDHLEHA